MHAKRYLRTAGWVGLALALIAAYAAYRTIWGQPFSIKLLADRQTIEYLLRNPELLSQVGLIDGTILDHHSDRLTAVGVAKRDADYTQFAGFLDELRAFDRAKLHRQDQLTYDVLVDYYQSRLALQRFPWLSSEGLYPIAPMWGTQVGLTTFLLSGHVINHEKTARHYVARLRAAGEKLDAVTAEMQRQAGMHVVEPPALIERSLAGIADTVRPAPADNPLVTSFVSRMNLVSGLDADLKDQLRQEAIDALQTRVYPAYARMSAALEAVKPEAERQAAGVGRWPDGAAYYAQMLRLATTTDATPEQLHALGLQEVSRIEAEMDELLKAQGLATGTVALRMQTLGQDPRFLYANTEEGRRQVLARYQQILDEVNARMPEAFRTVPTGKLTVVRMPLAAGAYYQPAAMDGSRPGQFNVNLRDVQELPSYGMKTLAYHEGIPGHHFQISTAMGLRGLPLIRRLSVYSAYVEGWALYAERLAAEMGLYQNDPWGDLGRLQQELFRAVRLVVDTGLHAQGWSRERAIAYMVQTTGLAEAEVVSEIERYMGLPGQACAYKVGQLKILALRAKAQAALGAKFNLKDFHAVVLENGAMPLTLLERLVDEWIERTQSRGWPAS